MSKSKIFLAIPIHEAWNAKSCVATYAAALSCQKANIQFDFEINESLVSRARCRQITRFLASGCEWYAQIDSDIEPLQRTPGENLFDMLLDNNATFCGGLYARNLETGDISMTSVPSDNRDEDGGWLVKMKWLSGGCWLVHRSTVSLMAEKYKELEFSMRRGGKVETACGLFIPYLWEPPGGGERVYLSEDWAFCQRWLDMGGSIWTDMRIRLVHWGMKGFELPTG